MTIFTIDVSSNGESIIRNGDVVIPEEDYVNMLCSNPPEARQCITCVCSGTLDEFTIHQVDGRDYAVCRACSTLNGGYCSDCGVYGNRRLDLSLYSFSEEDRVLCHNCYNTSYRQCRRCCNPFYNDDMTVVEGYHYCEPCLNSSFPRCKYCSNVYSGKQICRCGKTKSTDFLTNRYFSIELEIVDPNRESRTNWKSVSDSSISAGGIEYLSGPMVGASAIEEIKSECSLLNGFIDESCGFHLHMDFGEEDETVVKKFAATCDVLKDFAFEIVKPNRKESRYCKHYDSTFLNNLIEYQLDTTLYGTDERDNLSYHKRNKYHESRYYWFNMHSYYFRGTIEMRHHHGTQNPETILRWAELWLKVADWSKNNSIETIRNSDVNKILSESKLRSDTIAYFNNKKLSYNL